MPRRSRKNWILAGLILVNAVLLGPIALAVIGYGVGAAGFFPGLLMAAVPVPFYVAFALWVDRFESEPSWLLAVTFIWGAAIAVFFSLLFNWVGSGIFAVLAGDASASTYTAVLVAPLVEELTKGAALILLFAWKRDEFDNVTDGIVYASMVGLGFAMTENVQYYGQAVAEHTGATGVFVLRGIMGPFSHPLFTSMTGIGLGLARESDKRWVKNVAPLIGISVAILLHSIWNLAATFGAVFIAAYFLVMVPAFAGVGAIVIFSLRREANLIRTHLESVVAEGVLGREDVLVVTSVSRRLGASARALFTGGFGRWAARRRFHALATDLAFHSWRVSREADEDARAIHAELVADILAVRARLGLAREIHPPEPELVRRLTRETPLPVTSM